MPLPDLDLLFDEAREQERSLVAQLRVEIHRAATRIYNRRFRAAAEELAKQKEQNQ